MKKRILSMLLALALVLSLVPAVLPTVAQAALPDTPAGVRNHLPSTAKDVVYLSDMNWEYSVNYQNKEAIKNGAWSNGGAIVMGYAANNGGTTFTKGLGVMPKGTSATDTSHTIFDLADNGYAQNFFYAAAGITNGTAQGGGTTNGLVFEVWASYDKSVEDYTQAEYTLLERSGDPAKNTHVTKNYVYQFHLDVTGVRYLKLVVYAVGSISYMNANWAGVCVYNNPGYYPKSDLMGLNNGKDNTTWVPSGTDRFNTYHFDSIPADAVLLTSSTYKNPTNYTGTSKVVDFKSASGNLGKDAHWLGGVADQLTTTPTPNLKDGIVLKDASKFLRFNCRQPGSSGNQTDGWVTFDISDLDVDRFYTVIGGGNGTAKHTAYGAANGIYGGVKCQVWGAETKDGTYTLLSESEPIMLSQTGEFLVDITGVNFLKLRIQAKDTRIINGLDTLFYNPCVFKEWDVVASGAASAMQGTTEDYTTTIRHDFTTNYTYPGTINWAVTGAEKAGTKIENGKLTVDPAETATELKVTASITDGGKTVTSAPVTVAVTAAPVYTLEIQGPAEAGKNTEQTISSVVTKDGAAATYDSITWTLTGNTDSATKVENGKLTIGNEPVGTKLTVKASFTEYGITHEDTVEIIIAAYGVSIKGNTEMFPGSQLTLDAEVTNEGQPAEGTVTWTVEGSGTITPNGNQVTVNANGLGTIKVTASWTTPGGNPCTASHEIAVNAYTMDVSSAATAASKGSTVNLSALVKKNGAALDSASISWKVVNLTTGAVTDKTGTSVDWTVNEDVGTVLVFTASSEFGGLAVSDSWSIKVTDYKLVIDPANVQVEQGDTAELKASLTKADAPVANPVINWTVSKLDGSALNTNGDTLNLSASDPVGTELTVIASSVVDGETIVSAPAKVTVIAPIVYAVTLDKTAASVKQGESVSFAGSVTKDGADVADPALTWKVTGATAAGTAIDANGKLTVDAHEPAGTKLNVTATYEVGGKQFTSAAAIVTVTAAPAQDSGYSAVTGEYETLPSNVIYLSDDTVAWAESVNLGGVQAIRNGAWQNGAAIWIGGGQNSGGTNFVKGIGVQPQSPTATNDRGASWTTIDISSYDCDTFYAAVGCTNASNQANGHNSFIYQVYGGDTKDGTFTLLAQSDPITKTQTGEFKVDITGVKFLKLVIKCTDTGNHGYGNSVWANAAIYDSTAENYAVTATAPADSVQQGKDATFTAKVTKDDVPVTDQTITWTVTGGTKEGTKIDAEGKLTVDKAEPVGTKLTVVASIEVNGTTYTSAPIVVDVVEAISEYYQEDAFEEHTSGKYEKLASNVIYLSDVKWMESKNLGDKAAIRNGAWQNGAAIWIGGGQTTGGTKFSKGIGVQAYAPTAENNRGAAWTTIDVSTMKCDTFYAVVGATNASNQVNGHSSFIYQVYGTTEKNGEFYLLAQSEPLTKTQTGEFTVNIKNIKQLKLVIKCTETGGHGYGNSVWANACVFNQDGTPGKHPGYVTGNSGSGTVYETPKQKDAFNRIEDGIYLAPMGKVTFISDMEWVESVNLGGAEAIRNGAWQNGAAIWIGGGQTSGGTKFVKGIGVQPQAPNATNNRGASWTLVDVSDMDCDTFFAIVGGTNASNQQNGHNSFIYQVYGGDTKDGKFTLLAQSEPITKTQTGEFKVDITGVKFLKLVIKCTDTGNHGYGNSVWANACVFNSKDCKLVEAEEVVDNGPTAPTTTKPKPTAPTTTEEEPDSFTMPSELMIAIGAGAILLVALIVTIVLIVKKKKRK